MGLVDSVINLTVYYRPSYTPEQLANDAWNYIFTGKAPDFLNQVDKTEFALKAAEFNMLTREVEF